jgi:hypothetical protein
VLYHEVFDTLGGEESDALCGRSVGFIGTDTRSASSVRAPFLWITSRTNDTAHREHSGTDTTGATLSSNG